MWDSNSPLQLLKSMPEKLSKENLEKLQMVIDADKYKNSLVSGFDLCGMYAPFCRGCKKLSIYPCAIAYVNMMRSQGMKVEIDAKPVSGAENEKYAQKTEAIKPVAQIQPEEVEEVAVTAIPEEPVAEAVITEDVKPLETSVEEKTVKEEVQPVPEPIPVQPKERVKKKIRIAVARKKLKY